MANRFGFPGDEPVDPRYARFRDGWDKWIIGKPQYIGLRWSPWEQEGEWIEYAQAKFDYLDFGVVGPDSPLEAEFDFFGSPPHYHFEWKRSHDDLPSLWPKIEAKYSSVKAQHGRAVWNPYDGSWRDVRWKSAGSGGGGGTPTKPPVNPELERRLAELRALYDRHEITDEVFKLRTLELLREYG